MAEPPRLYRVGISIAGLAAGYLAGLVVERTVRELLLPEGELSVTLFWFGVGSVLGWLFFGLPVVVLGPWRRRFRSLASASLIGGVAGFLMLAILYVTLASPARVFTSASALAFLGLYGLCAAIIGGVAMPVYVFLLRSWQKANDDPAPAACQFNS